MRTAHPLHTHCTHQPTHTHTHCPQRHQQQARQLRGRIASSETYDLAGFKNLLEDLRGAPADAAIRAVYEELVAAFPTAVRGGGGGGVASC